MSELNRYTKAMIAGDLDACICIEQLHDLHGYPPELVAIGLAAADRGDDPVMAVEAYIEDQA